jgi:hypothetical protein
LTLTARTFRDQQLGDPASVDRLDLDGCLVCLDLGDDIAGIDPLALCDQPLCNRALIVAREQLGHSDFDRHGSLLGCAVAGARRAGALLTDY